jgi:mono/diheme cytochrome c family protein
MSNDARNLPGAGGLTRADQEEGTDVVELHAAVLRELPEPAEGAEPLNLWIVALIAGLLLWGGLYMGLYSARFDAMEFSEIPHGKPEAVAAGSADPLAAKKQKGAIVFNNCAACHNDDGAGKPGIAPALAASDWVNAAGAGRLIRIVLHGAGGPMTVSGQLFNAPGAAMNPWKDTLSDDDIANVLTYVRSAWGNKGGEVLAADVAAIRAAEASRSDPWTEAELLKIPDSGAGAAPAGGALSAEELKAKLKELPADQLQTLLKELGK